jgi:hypothetical protein
MLGNHSVPGPDQVDVHRAREGRNTLVRVDSEVAVGNAGALAVRPHEVVDRQRERHQQAAERRHVVEAVLVEQHLVVTLGQEKAPCCRVVRALGDVEEGARSLLLEPLPRVARVDAGGLGQLARRQRPSLGERPVEP